MEPIKDLCFVLMPFGRKSDPSTGTMIDFDAVYRELIAPAIEQAGMDALRADDEITGGIIHRPMFERLVLCGFVIADLTTANPNVFYELGVRHAARPWSTLLLFAEGGRLPFDVAPLRALPYRLGAEGIPADLETVRGWIVRRLEDARNTTRNRPAADSPLFQLLDGYPDRIHHERTDVFRREVEYSAGMKRRLGVARTRGPDAIREIEEGIGDIQNVESGVAVDLFLSYRAVSAWGEMVRLAEKMPRVLFGTVLIQEQYALALNRLRRGEEAERVLMDLIECRGPSSETYGILGRVYKDRWEEALRSGDSLLAPIFLEKAIDVYLRGFETDWRDAYPGVNAVTLMEFSEPPDPRRAKLVPVVSYSVERKLASAKPDYWDHATRLEIGVLEEDRGKAVDALGRALVSMREKWEGETTARNLRLIREARERRGEDAGWIADAEQRLLGAKPPVGGAA